jgi:thiamine-phosphate pyrophosphorylase
MDDLDLPDVPQGFAERFAAEAREPAELYLLSPPQLEADFADRLKAALDAGPIAAFQLRLKGLDDHAIARAAEPIQAICAERDVAFIVNDSTALAKRLGADGVHLGQGDGDPREAREVLGRDAQIGVTCHNSRHLAMEAGEAGADYVAFGAFYPTSTKEVSHQADPAIMSWWSVVSPIPCVAIGGITAQNVTPLVTAGADFIAVSGVVWNDPAGESAAVRQLLAAMGR